MTFNLSGLQCLKKKKLRTTHRGNLSKHSRHANWNEERSRYRSETCHKIKQIQSRKHRQRTVLQIPLSTYVHRCFKNCAQRTIHDEY